VVEPLHDILQRGLAGLNKRNKSNTVRVQLSDLGWSDTHDQAFASLKAALVHAATLAVRCIRESLGGGVGTTHT
jgi:hypothetical protein